jgi:hypothetical protein
MSRAYLENVEWPTADEVALAIVAAARVTDRDPFDIAKNSDNWRDTEARALAFIPLGHRFRTPSRNALGRLVGSGCASYAGNTYQRVCGGRVDMAQLNEVNRALGWPGMTADEAKDACLWEPKHSASAMAAFADQVRVVSDTKPDPDWSPDDKALRERRARGETYPQIAAAMGKTDQYWRVRAQRLGLAKERAVEPDARADGIYAEAMQVEPAAPSPAPIVPSNAARQLAAAAAAMRKPKPGRALAVREQPSGHGSDDAGIAGKALAITPQRVRELTEFEGLPTRAQRFALEYAKGYRMQVVLLAGDPPLWRSALADRQPGDALVSQETTAPDQLFVEGYMGAVNSDDAAFPEAFADRGPAYKAGWLKGFADRGAIPQEQEA